MRKNLYTYSVLLIFSAAFAFLPAHFEESEVLQKLSIQAQDVLFKIRHFTAEAPLQAKEIVLVTIDDESCQQLDARWPWSRKIFASLVQGLKAQGARVIGLNVSFMGAEAGEAKSTQDLADAIKDHGRVIVGTTSDNQSRLIRPYGPIADNVYRYGYLEKIVDIDFAIRRSYWVRFYSTSLNTGHQQVESSFPVQLAAAYWDFPTNAEWLVDITKNTLTATGQPKPELEVGPDGETTINYTASFSDFEQIPAWKVVRGRVPAGFFSGKVVLVGLTSALLSDIHATPLGMMPGVVIQANEFLSILTERTLRFVPDAIAFLLSWLVGLCILILFLLRRFAVSFAAFFIAVFGLFLGTQLLFARDIVMNPLILEIGPMFSFLIGISAGSLRLLVENRFLETKAIHDKLTGLYKYEYLREVLEDEWKRAKKENKPITVIMTDLDKFKNINDTLGHETGNLMIQRAGNVIKESVRKFDIVARYGGDEFVILLIATTESEAIAYRDRLRNYYHEMATGLKEPLLQHSSISIGYATYEPGAAHAPLTTQELVERADKDLFEDKKNRRGWPSR